MLLEGLQTQNIYYMANTYFRAVACRCCQLGHMPGPLWHRVTIMRVPFGKLESADAATGTSSNGTVVLQGQDSGNYDSNPNLPMFPRQVGQGLYITLERGTRKRVVK